MNNHPPQKLGTVGQYRVEFHHCEPRHAQIFVFSFTPAKNK
jgi:hypothetical protein